MEAEDPLSQLRDIHLPDAVSFWPPAPGWWVLLALVILALIFIYRRSIAAMVRRRKLGVVVSELDDAYERYLERSAFEQHRKQAGLDYLFVANQLLKRVALVMYPDQAPGELTGRAWLAFLDSCDHGKAFSEGAGTALADGIYRRTFDVDVDALQALVRQWIERRYREKQQESRDAGAKGVTA